MKAQIPSLPDSKSPNAYHVYFQPPENITMVYPAIVYERDSDAAIHANDSLYHNTKRYRITVIDRNPDSTIPDAVSRLPMTAYVGHNTIHGLHHEMYATYF